MTQQEATPEYIKIEDLPPRLNRAVWPWEKWAKIPEGMGLEIDLNGVDPNDARSSLGSSLASNVHNSSGLVCYQRSGRLFIMRPKQPQP